MVTYLREWMSCGLNRGRLFSTCCQIYFSLLRFSYAISDNFRRLPYNQKLVFCVFQISNMKRLLFPILLVCIVTTAISQAPLIEYQLKVGGLTEPLDVVNAGDGTNRLFIVQRGGLVRIWDGNALLPNPFLNVSTLLRTSGSEEGLLSLVFHPLYESNRYFFIYYTNSNGDNSIARYRTMEGNPNLADPASAKILLTIPHPGASNHNGAKLIFGTDGYLYVGTGDGGGGNDPSNNAQTGTSLLGKMLRLDVNDFDDATPPFYAIPPGNPYNTDASVRDEIIALGLRNPWRWSFDRLTGDMWIGDVGQGAREEVDYRRADSILQKTNYGWRCLEGKITNPSPTAACPPPADNVFPIFDYPHNSSGGFVITGGYVYRGNEFPAMYGYYICTDYATGNIWLIKSNGAGGWDITPQTVNKLTNVSGYGEDENGVLYAVRLTSGTANSGALYKVITGTALPVQFVSFTAVRQMDKDVVSWTVSCSEAGMECVLERSMHNSSQFVEIDRKNARLGNAVEYRITTKALQGDAYYRLQMITSNGRLTYSPVILLKEKNEGKQGFTAYRAGDRIQVMLNEPARTVRVYNAIGAELYKQSFNDQSGFISIPVSQPQAVLFIQVITATGSSTKKLAF
jgi:glucose/arabinose dehydrogenase